MNRIEAKRGDRQLFLLERSPGGEWSLPGKWPTRKAEAEALVNLLGGLRSRFLPEKPKGEPPNWKAFGLDRPALTVAVRAGEREHRLEFGEPAETGEGNRFSRPTYLRIDGGNEAIRLAPGLIAAIDRPGDYYQQRRLFAGERVPREAGSSEKVEQLVAKSLSVDDTKGGNGSYTLVHSPEDWHLTQPVHDRVDPDKLRSILSSAPDLWAEQFVPQPYKPLADYGLEPPEETLSVTRPGGDTVKLFIGRISPTIRERRVARPSPPGMPPGPPQMETIKEEFRYAKLENNKQIFEIKADRLKDLFVPAKDLRDARLARFNTSDARRLELKCGGQDIVLVKDKERWKLEKPMQADAETSKVNDVLDKLSGLSARDADVIDKPDPKVHGFADPAKVGTVTVAVEEEKGEGESKTKTSRTFTFRLGKHDQDKKKLYVRVDGWERVNAVEDPLVSLVNRPALAYRGRRVLDFSTADLDRIEVQRPGETVALKQVKDVWRLEKPIAVEADSGKASGLASTLGNLEATEFVNDAPKPQDLESYGLVKDPVRVKMVFTEASKKPAQTLLLGKVRPDKTGEFFARLESGPSVFAVKKETRESIDQGSLVYRPLQLWQVASDEIKSLRIQQAAQPEYTLTRKDSAWQIGGPFEAAALTSQVDTMLNELTGPRAERFESHAGKDLKVLGLDAPHLRIALTTSVKKSGDDKKEPPKPEEKERTLIVGKPTEKDAKTRFARLGDSETVFVVGDKLLSAVDQGALTLLDRKLLSLDSKTIERVQFLGGAKALTLVRKGEDWQATESTPTPFTADRSGVDALLRACSDLQAVRFAAYGTKIDPAKYGLDKPAVSVKVTVQPPAADGKKPAPVTHTMDLGKNAEGSSGERYARLDGGPGVAVLGSTEAGEFGKSYLDFVNRTLVKADASQAKELIRHMGAQVLNLRKGDEGWQMIKPQEMRADDTTMDQLVDQLASLQAKKVVAYQEKDLKPFGLDAPAASVMLALGKPVALKIGKPVEGPGTEEGERFVMVDGSDVVGVLPATLARQLLADPIRFRDRTVARFTDADRALLERGPRKATFTKVDGTWKLTAPLEGDAEQVDLDDFINGVARLRADELVADKPADLKAYGLDKPEAVWRFQSGTKDLLNLLIGARDKGGNRCYAKLAAGTLVFLLDQQLTNRVLGEYRKRSVWPTPPDAAQVDRIRFGYTSNPFELEKVDGNWKVAGKPEMKVNSQAVSDALSALSGLKIERYVVDKGADLKLYGLEPPNLVLEVKIPSGSRTLEIGHAEGESKRFYARLPEKDRTDVFVIAEADASRIVRDLTGFVEKPTKPATPAKPETPTKP
jgi:hypothetical protein